MTWKSGQSGNPQGKPTSDKTFAQALRVAVNADDEVTGKKKLRMIAEQVVTLAIAGESWAVQQVADRLDGKPAQESTVTIDDKREGTDWTRGELVALLDDAQKGGAGTAKANGRLNGADKLH